MDKRQSRQSSEHERQPIEMTVRHGSELGTCGVTGRTRRRRGVMGWPVVLMGLTFLCVVTVAATMLRANGTLDAWQQGAVQTSEAEEITLGYFGNLTHGPALVGVEKGFFEDSLGDTRLKTEVFNTGPTTIEAMNSGEVDIAFMGPNPAINSFVKSGGESVTIISGATSGGAQFVVSDDIKSEEDLSGKTFATPDFGGTQDVALRVWLKEKGYEVDTGSPDAVSITPMPSGQALQTFRQGSIDGFWGPQPWVTRMAQEENGKILVDERHLWPHEKYPTTVLAVRTDFLKEHPETVKKLLSGVEDSVDYLNSASEDEVIKTLNAGLEGAKTEPLDSMVIKGAMGAMEWTTDPMEPAYSQLLENGVKAGTTKKASLDGFVDDTFINEVRRERGMGLVGEEPVAIAPPAQVRKEAA